MAKPFALAPNGGGYLIFLFLLLSIPLLYSQLHLVQLSFDLGDDIDVLTMFAIELPVNVPMPRRRRQWDPGINVTQACLTPTVTTASTMSTDSLDATLSTSPSCPVWDPSPTMPPPAAEMPLAPTASMTTVRALSPSLWLLNSLVCGVPQRRRRRQWDPGILKCSKNGTTTTVDRDWSRVDRSIDHSMSLALSIQSLFQYSHPVLSRPTVPNIR